MPSVDDLKQSNYLTQADVGKGLLVTISHWEEVNMAQDNKPKDMKYVLFFREDHKPMSLNYTNGSIIGQIAGTNDLDEWAGTKIVLFVDPSIMFGTKRVGGIRARAPKNQPSPSVLPDNEPPVSDADVPAGYNEELGF